MEVYHSHQYFRKGETIYVNKSVYIQGYHSEHTHDFLEITYINQGSGYHWFNGVKIEVQKGDLFFINFNVKHYFEPITDDFKWMNCVFLPEVIDPSLIHSENAEDVLKLSLFSYIFPTENIKLPDLQFHDSSNEFEYIFEEMLKEYDRCQTGYQNVLKHYLFILLIRMFRTYSLLKKKDYQIKQGNETIEMVIDYLMKNKLNDINLENVARKAFLSPTYFSTLFKQKTGQSLMQFLHRLRIQKACEYLQNTDTPIMSIMFELGYKDTKFFYELFKRYVKITPGEYRKQHRNNKK